MVALNAIFDHFAHCFERDIDTIRAYAGVVLDCRRHLLLSVAQQVIERRNGAPQSRWQLARRLQALLRQRVEALELVLAVPARQRVDRCVEPRRAIAHAHAVKQLIGQFCNGSVKRLCQKGVRVVPLRPASASALNSTPAW